MPTDLPIVWKAIRRLVSGLPQCGQSPYKKRSCAGEIAYNNSPIP